MKEGLWMLIMRKIIHIKDIHCSHQIPTEMDSFCCCCPCCSPGKHSSFQLKIVILSTWLSVCGGGTISAAAHILVKFKSDSTEGLTTREAWHFWAGCIPGWPWLLCGLFHFYCIIYYVFICVSWGFCCYCWKSWRTPFTFLWAHYNAFQSMLALI